MAAFSLLGISAAISVATVTTASTAATIEPDPGEELVAATCSPPVDASATSMPTAAAESRRSRGFLRRHRFSRTRIAAGVSVVDADTGAGSEPHVEAAEL